MTELVAALLGALVGGGLAAWAGSWQTGKVLKHETELAAAERRESQRVDEERRQSLAADHLIAALGEYVTLSESRSEKAAYFVRIAATEDVHRARERRSSVLMQAGASYAYALPEEVRERWDALIWLVRFNIKQQPERADIDRRRDYSDLLNYIEYVRRSLVAVSEGYPMLPQYPAPDVLRQDRRIWGFKPEEGGIEPDLTDWQLRDRLVGKVQFSSGEVRWYGPNGLVVDLPPEHVDTGSPGDEDDHLA